MICPNCGSSITGTGNTCKHCGPSPHKRKPIWPKLLTFSAVGLALFIGIYFLSKDDLARPVKGQLSAIRDDQLTEAYYGYTSQDFQKTVSLEAFREFVKHYPALLKNHSFSIDTMQEENGLGIIKGDLKTAGSAIPVEYRLIKENGQWKILNLQFLPNVIADASIAAPKADNREIEELLIPINLQLKALQQKDYEKSYQGLMTKDFEKNTPFDMYKRFIDSYPILRDYKRFDVSDKKFENNQGLVLVLLQDEKGDSLPLEYRLTKEDGQWKVWSMRLILPESRESTENSKILSGIIRAQIDAIDKGNLAEAYQSYTSKEFKTVTSQEQFENLARNFAAFQNKNISDVNVDQVTNAGNVVILNGFLSAKNDKKYPFEYDFVNEDGQWKIIYMTISAPSEATNEAQNIAKPANAKLTFVKMDIGSNMDSNGNITDAGDVLSVKEGDIHANLFVKDALKGNKVEVLLKHLESASNVPPVTVVVQKDGDSTLSFTFSPPATVKGWPKGNYEMHVSSADAVEPQIYKFKVE